MPAKAKERWFVVHDFPTGVLGGTAKGAGRVVPGHHIKVDDLAQTPVCVVLSMSDDPKAAAERRRLADLAAAAPELLELVEALMSEERCEAGEGGACQVHNHVAGQECPQAAARNLLSRLGARSGRRAAR